MLNVSKQYATSLVQTIAARHNTYSLRTAAGSIKQAFIEATALPAPLTDALVISHLILKTKCAPNDTAAACAATTPLQY